MGAVLTPSYTVINNNNKRTMRWLGTPPPPLLDDCLNFYNELWVCFTDDDSSSPGAEPNSNVTAYGCDSNAQWHLHSVSHPSQLPPDGQYQYSYNRQNADVPIYILDTWIDASHPEFEGRVRYGAAFTTGGAANGHGTHVAGLAGSKSFGVNKLAQLVGVQVLDDSGFGSWQTILSGLVWVTTQPMGVVSMSIGGSKSDIVNRVVRLMVERGWKVVVAAGNDAGDACQYSPASAADAVTVGSFDMDYGWSGFSNYGPCVDLAAPGSSLLSTWPNGLYAYASGTSMATPIVAGVWSLYPEWLVAGDVLNNCQQSLLTGLPSGTPSRTAFSPDTAAAC